MDKQKKTSTKIQESTSYIQDNVVNLQVVTSPAKKCSDKVIVEPSTITSQNTGDETSINSQCASEVTLSNLTTITRSQTQNNPLHMDSTEMHDLLQRNEKYKPSSVTDQCPIQHDSDEQHMNGDKISASTGANIILPREKSLSSVTTETEITGTLNTSAESEPNVKASPHCIDQEKEIVAFTEYPTQTNLDSSTTLNNGDNNGDPPTATEKQSSSQVTGLTNADKNRDTISPINYTVEVQISSDVHHSVGINIDLTASTEKDDNSSNTVQSSPTFQGISKESNGSVSEVATGGELGKDVEVLSATKATQGNENTGDSNVSTDTLQATCICSECPTHNSSSRFHAVGSAESSKESPVQSSTNRAEVDVSTNTAQKPSVNSKRAKVAESGKDPVLTSVTNAEADKVPVTTNMTEKEALFVLKEKNTAVKVQVCVQAKKGKKAKQHTLLDAPVSKISPSASSKPLNSMRGPFKGPDASMKQTETQKERPASIKLHSTQDIPEVNKIIGRKHDSTHKTQDMYETDNTSLNISKETPTGISKLAASSKEMSAEKNGDQNSDMKLETEKDNVLRNNLTKVTKKSRSKTKSKSSDKTLNSNEEPQENKGEYTSIVHESNCLSKNKEECKAITHENKTVDAQKSQKNSNSVNNDADEELRNINAEEKNNTTILDSEESYNKVCKGKRRQVKNKQIQIDMNPQSSEKLKQMCSTEYITQDLTNNEHVGPQNENIQNSNTDLPANENNKAGINDQKQQKMKKHRGNRRNKTAQQQNERDLKGQEYEDSEFCGHKEEKLESKTDSRILHEDKTENSKSEDILLRPNVNTSNNSTHDNKNVSTALSKQHLIHLARRETSEMTFIPDVKDSLLAPESTNFITTADEEEEMEYKLVQREVFLPYVCHVCKILGQSYGLKRCRNCKMISYCSKEHQRLHWPQHRDLCKVISDICKHERMTNLFQKAVGILPDEYRYYRIYYVNKCAQELGRNLDSWEKEMIYFPQVCHTCYEFDIQKLTSCHKCHHVSYCKPSHLKSDHDIWCKEFQVYRDFILCQFHHGMIQPSIPKRVLQHYAPLTGDIRTFMLSTAGVSNKSLLMNKLDLVALTDTGTCPLTVLFSLQNANFSLEEIKFLTIHLVGAEMHFEIDNLRKWELLLLHLIPSLRILKIVFVGPELNSDNAFFQIVDKSKMCRKCHIAGRKVVYDFWKGLYHDFLKSKNYKKPDLISAFNAGLHRLSDFEGKDTWSPTIEAMLKEPDIPVIVTEYTEKEMPLDLQRIQSIVDSLEIIMSPAKNPFASSKPSLNFLSEETIPVIFKNYYITILKRGRNVKVGNVKTKM